MASRSSGGGTVLASGIRTRERKERKLYSDDWALGDEEIEGYHTFNLHEKVTSPKFELNFVKDLTDKEFGLSYVQRNGFNWPLLFKKSSQLGIVIPSGNFTIKDVRMCVGSRRMLDVMDVNTQKNVEMTMKDWQRYYDSQDKDKLLNVISLEFSHTKLESLVEPPTLVKQIDWVEKVWPRHLKEAQTESTNVLEDMMYPKVQKYCLMSVSGCYTDFHIDFGGTSVWYHILKGKKIFWLIPPSERNLQLYEQWVLSGKQSDIFFGDTVEKCARVELQAGYTFFIPTGWIHAVYTPDDSLVFGGNFLHSFGIEKQLRVATVEDTTHVPQKFRYPFFTEMLWYLLERYVHVLLGRSHLSLPSEEQEKYERWKSKCESDMEEKKHTHLTQFELHGMKAIVMYLHSLPTSKKFVPELIKDPIALIRDVRRVVEEHRYDSPELSITSTPVLEWWEREPVKFTVRRSAYDSAFYVKKRRTTGGDENKSTYFVKLPPNVAKVRHRRVRCKDCEPCTRGDCRQCVFCKDMSKYGGPGTMKQTCKLKKCLQPILPVTACCYLCQLDGWMRPVQSLPIKPPADGSPNMVMECVLCFKISHQSCLEAEVKGVESIINEDLPNSWECAECIQLGYNKEYTHNRAPTGRSSLAGSDGNVKFPFSLSESEEGGGKMAVKKEPLGECKDSSTNPDAASINQDVNSTADQEKESQAILQMPTWDQLQARVTFPLNRPTWIVRPAPPSPPVPDEDEDDEDESGTDDEIDKSPKKRCPPPPPMRREVMLPVFSKLSSSDLLVVMRVCRLWAQWSIHPSLWKSVDLSHRAVAETHLEGTVRRQPAELILNWSVISQEQFSWLTCRLPQMKSLHCEGLSWGEVRALVSPYCPCLLELNVSFCEGIDDQALSALLKAPPFSRPGFRDISTRLRHLTKFRLSGTAITDNSVALVTRSLPFLTDLDLSECLYISDLASELLSHSTSLVCHSLTHLDLRGCHRLTPWTLPSLAKLPLLSHLALDPCNGIPRRAIEVWGTSHGYCLRDDGIMVRMPVVVSNDPSNIDGDSDLEKADSSKPESLSEKQKDVEETKSEIINDEEKKSDEAKLPDCVAEVSPDDEVKNVKMKNECEKGESKGEKVKSSPSKKEESSDVPNQRGACKIVDEEFTVEKMGNIEETDEDFTNICELSTGDKTSDVQTSSTDDICRRSERKKKSKKHQFSVKKKALKDKLLRKREAMQKRRESIESGSESMSEESSSTKKTFKKPRTISRKVSEKAFHSKELDSHSKKKKKLKACAKEKKSKCSTDIKSSKKEKEFSKNLESKSDLKVHLSLSAGHRYSKNLRKKSRHEESSVKKDEKNKKTETHPSKHQKELSSSSWSGSPLTSSSPSSQNKSRKERTGSFSSTSSSSSSSQGTHHLSKKVKIELDSISKFHRRKSDSTKQSTINQASSSTSKIDLTTLSGGIDKGSRERPERSHRSPRRLSSS